MTREKLYNWFFFLVLILLSYLIFRLLLPFFIPVLWAVVLAIALYPMYKWVNRHLKFRANLSALIMTILTILLLFIPTFLLIVSLTTEAVNFLNTANISLEQEKINSAISKILNSKLVTSIVPPERLQNLIDKFNLESVNLANIIYNTLLSASQKIVSISQSIIKNISLLVLNVAISIFTLFFMFRDGKNYYNYALSALPLEDRAKKEITFIFHNTIKVVLISNLAIAAVQGLMMGIIFTILGLSYPLLATAITFILSIIPLIGTGFVYVPVSIYLFLTGFTAKALILLIFGVVIISSVDNVLRPLMIGKQAKLNTLFLFLVIMGGLSLFGFSGIIIGPLALSLFISIVEIFKEKYLSSGSI